MDKEKVLPRFPEPGEYVRGNGTLIEVVDRVPPPPPPAKDYVFETVEARCELRLNDDVLSVHQTLWEFGGKGAAVSEAIKDMTKFMEDNGVGPDSDLEVVVVKVTEQIRMRPTLNCNDYNRYDRQFRSMDSFMAGCYEGLPPATEEVVWSSKGVIDEPETT